MIDIVFIIRTMLRHSGTKKLLCCSSNIDVIGFALRAIDFIDFA